MRLPTAPALLPACKGRRWGSRPSGHAAPLAQPVNYPAAEGNLPVLDEGQLSGAAAQLWWSYFAFAVLRLWLLIMAGDAELNPGPATAGRSGGWLGVSDGVAAELLALLRGVASRLGAMPIDLTREQQLERPAHGWNHPAIKVLAPQRVQHVCELPPVCTK